MYAWVIYDIHKNKVRTRIARRCKYYGLKRVQKSVFLGKLKEKWLKSLHTDLSTLVNQRTDRLFIVPMSKSDFTKILQAGTPPPLEQTVVDPKVRFI